MATCSPVSIVVSGSVTMSASIATAICATVSGEVADPAVFHVMTRMLLSVLAGSVSVPRPRVATIDAVRDRPRCAAIERDREREAADRTRDREEQRDDEQRPRTRATSSPRNETICAIGKMPLDAEERRAT